MKLDYSKMGPNERLFMGGTVKVNGREIKQVFFVDTAAGIVKSYDVLGDGKVHAGREFVQQFANAAQQIGREIHVPPHPDHAVWEVLRGNVELLGPDRRPFIELAIADMRETR